MRYVIVNIGCIECDESTSVPAMFPTKSQAIDFIVKNFAKKTKYAPDVAEEKTREEFDKNGSVYYFGYGQHSVEIFAVEDGGAK